MIKKEVYSHLIASLAAFVLLEIIWLFTGSFSILKAFIFASGLIIGTFLLDADHLIYWFFLKPDFEESKIARELWQKKNWKGLLKHLEANHKNHVSLVFHHFIFQVLLLVLTFFIFTSTSNVFGKGLVLALDLHLLVDIREDLKADPNHLRNWLFARSPLASLHLPVSWLKIYWLAYAFLVGGIAGAFIR
ncbi:MAG: hypothetical protein ABIB61_00390 [Candidatus Shapirobacteria bacterium]